MKRIVSMIVVAAAAWAAPVDAKVPSPDVVCRVELDRGVLPAGQNERAVVKVTLEAPEVSRSDRPPVNLCLVLDRSGSMSGDKMERAKEAAIEAVRRLSASDIVSLVIYDHEVETIVPAQSAANIEWIEARIRQIQTGGNTALYGGVSQGASEIRKNTDRRFVSRIILVSDGIANVGPSSPDELGRMGTSLMKEGISVTTIGLGNDYNEDLMTRLAQSSDGNTYFVRDSSDLPRIFAAELGDVLSVAARDVLLEIECPDGVRPIRIIGRDGVIRGNKVELRLNQLYGGQQKYALVEVEVPATESSRTRQVAFAKVDYDNAITSVRAQSSSSVDVTFSPMDEEVQKSVNGPVMKVVILNEIADARERAVEFDDKGMREEAAAALAAPAEQYDGYIQRDLELKQEADKLDLEAGQVSSGGYDAPGRKKAKTSSANIRSQQQYKE